MSSLPLSSTRAHLNSVILPPVSNAASPEINNYNDNSLDASKDARQIVRMAQCPQCSLPLQSPTTLPCGNSLCMRCIPELHVRQNISYPALSKRLQGFTCPFSTCKLEHAIGDCEKDVVLSKIMSIVRLEMDKAKEEVESIDAIRKIHEPNSRSRTKILVIHPEERTRIIPGGRLLATYNLSEMGELPYNSEVKYISAPRDNDQSDVTNDSVLCRLKEIIRSELDCQVCYSIYLDPHITTCGHTFCKKCILRALDHSNLCPICRTPQSLSPGQSTLLVPSIILGKLINGLCPDIGGLRAKTMKNEEKTGSDDMDLPLFICALSFPGTPTFLHIFEPRYRLMMRRVVESGDRKFGMLFRNPNRVPQGNLGSIGFFEYGTLLHIVNMHLLSNGHSLIETIGVSRFRVLKYGYKDDYTIGRVERVDDISITAEESMEAHEIQSAISTTPNAASRLVDTALLPETRLSTMPHLETMSTQALFELGSNFVKKMREQSAHWLQTRVFQVYGECPQDPGMFPWWFASVLPIKEMEKYELLTTRSVRKRLKICAEWVVEIERQTNNSRYSNCDVF